ncbi:TetR/AcrR family transcriptional regulator [Nesterenkonia lutea]|uniref:AcrR family transcriptional regulator n=1 Tax=Nesterenkonia lutea TaxID=272919 RepID=A0ABR9JFY9_9MICC|nr:TetR/AcrR family transcriptional regulator [Nesterenkonia lutea]MBE1524853.1 AcrR family transcriptional regulator [Nesterenkonia lutea]
MACEAQRSGTVETRRGRPRSEASHQAVLDATSRLLSESSYEELTVEAIASEAGVSKQTIYRWWKSKATVVLEVMLTGEAEIEIVPMPSTGDLRADCLTWIRSMLVEAFQETHVGMARSLVVAGLQGDPGTERLLEQASMWDHGPLAERLRESERAGELREGVDITAAASAMGDPLIFRMLTGAAPTTSWAESLVDVVVTGLLRPEEDAAR